MANVWVRFAGNDRSNDGVYVLSQVPDKDHRVMLMVGGGGVSEFAFRVTDHPTHFPVGCLSARNLTTKVPLDAMIRVEPVQ
jgi:hypothetical protein